MAHQYLTNICKSEKLAMKNWLQFYPDQFNIALTDTLTTGFFLKEFNKDLALNFSGLRHDSGNPIQWGYRIIDHYKKLGIDPKSKLLVFSDSLNPENVLKIYNEFNDKIQLSFGMGTNLSNDLGLKAPNIVIKIVECCHYPLIKISDDLDKAICTDSRLKEFALHLVNKTHLCEF